MTKITVCDYYDDSDDKHRYMLAVCHNTPTNLVKLKFISSQLRTIARENIGVIKDFEELDGSANEIITNCLRDAFESRFGSLGPQTDVLEIICYADVNLTQPATMHYPTVFTDKNQCAAMFAAYFPNCILIKRVFVSADQPILDNAQETFQRIGGEILKLPVILDSFVGKSYRDLYTEIHRVDVGLIDAILKYHVTFQLNIAEEDDTDACLDLEDYIEILQEKIVDLLAIGNQELNKHFTDALQENFSENLANFAELSNKILSINKSTLLSIAFSYLTPAPLRNMILSTPAYQPFDYAVVSIGKLSQLEVGEALSTIAAESQQYFEQFLQYYGQAASLSEEVLKLMHSYKTPGSNPQFISALHDVIEPLTSLFNILQKKSQHMQCLASDFDKLRLKIQSFIHEAKRVKSVSHASFFSETTASSIDTTMLPYQTDSIADMVGLYI